MLQKVRLHREVVDVGDICIPLRVPGNFVEAGVPSRVPVLGDVLLNWQPPVQGGTGKLPVAARCRLVVDGPVGPVPPVGELDLGCRLSEVNRLLGRGLWYERLGCYLWLYRVGVKWLRIDGHGRVSQCHR